MERAQSSPCRAGTEQSGISSDDDPVAQSAEQLPFKQWVRGSNPRRVTKTRKQYRCHRLKALCINCLRVFCALNLGDCADKCQTAFLPN